MKDRFIYLLSEYFDGQLSRDEEQELLTMLQQDPQKEAEFYKLLQQSQLLNLLCNEDDAKNIENAVMVRIYANQDANIFTEKVQEKIRRKRIKTLPLQSVARTLPSPTASLSSKMTPIKWIGLAATLILTIGVTISLFSLRGTGSPSHFLISQMVGLCKDATTGRLLSSDAILHPGTRIWVDSSALLQLIHQDGITLTFSQGEIQISPQSSSKSIHIIKGKLEVYAQKQATSLLISTPHAQLRVVGTQFSLVVDEKDTFLTVQNGKIEFESTLAKFKKIVSSGETISASSIQKLPSNLVVGPLPRQHHSTLSSLFRIALADATTSQPIPGFDPIINHQEINLAKLPTQKINIIAIPQKEGINITKVVFRIQGPVPYHFFNEPEPNVSIETTAPFCLQPDDKGKAPGWNPSPGEHILTVSVYLNGQKVPKETQRIRFLITNQL